MKKQQDDRALAVLTKVYKDEGRARSQLKEIRSTRNVGKAPFSETFKLVLQWNNLQRYITTNTNGALINCVFNSEGFFLVSCCNSPELQRVPCSSRKLVQM